MPSRLLRVVTHGQGFAALDVRCDHADRTWRAEAPAVRHMDADRHMLVLVRCGRYLTRAEGDEVLADRGSGFLEGPGSVRSFRHVDDAPDRSTAVLFAWSLVGLLAEANLPVPTGPVAVTPHLHLAHRRLLDRDDIEPEERVSDVLRAMVGSAEPVLQQPPAESPNHRRIARLAAEAMQAEPAAAARLTQLAALVGVSSWHLSRVFHRHYGVTIGRYRTNLRLIAAIEDLRDGEQNLTDLSLRHGFFDQAHFTRCFTRAVGVSPLRVARQLRQSLRARSDWRPGKT